MAIEGTAATVPLSIGARTAGLNHIAALRARHWEHSGWAQLTRFLDDMRDRRDPAFHDNQRALAALFYLAKIPTGRHALPPEALTLQEQQALIRAMNHLRAVVSLFPDRLTLAQ
ncbi:DUF5347 domain-containing protein [Siccibacter turicensis]|uniref:DUF5347 domain-containing protein n=1 Tax=Siccibacter turicensis TaxID=357233 RepID=UPI002A6B3708|nr:DUF5347 domain-containing protein [Siccibacter turicensis]MDY0971373.1 DUF5347 domain-containing protein [Siccibacter turicensis]